MTLTCTPDPFGTIVASRGKSAPIVVGGGLGVFPLPTDPLFYATLTLVNVVVGSRYRVTRNDTGDELATGVAATTTVVLPGLACYANPMQVNITVRNASGSTKYRVFDTAALMVKTGTSAYVLQQLD